MENVLGVTPPRLRMLTSALESIPPERNTPTGTSLTSCSRTASSSEGSQLRGHELSISQ